MTITDAGKAALAALAMGTMLRITSIVITNGQYTPTAADTALQGTVLKTYPEADIGGRVAANEFEWSVSDDSADDFTSANSIGVVGLYAGNTLFSVASRPAADGFLYTKPAITTLIISNLFQVNGTDVTGITFNNLTAYPQASENFIGMVERATQAEAEAQTGQSNSLVLSVLRSYQAVTARIASQTEAEAGTNSVKLMTPERTEEYFNAKVHVSTAMPTPADWKPGDLWFVREA